MPASLVVELSSGALPLKAESLEHAYRGVSGERFAIYQAKAVVLKTVSYQDGEGFLAESLPLTSWGDVERKHGP